MYVLSSNYQMYPFYYYIKAPVSNTARFCKLSGTTSVSAPKRRVTKNFATSCGHAANMNVNMRLIFIIIINYIAQVGAMGTVNDPLHFRII